MRGRKIEISWVTDLSLIVGGLLGVFAVWLFTWDTGRAPQGWEYLAIAAVFLSSPLVLFVTRWVGMLLGALWVGISMFWHFYTGGRGNFRIGW